MLGSARTEHSTAWMTEETKANESGGMEPCLILDRPNGGRHHVLRVTFGKQYSLSAFQLSSLCVLMKPFRSTASSPYADPAEEKKPGFARSDRDSE